MGTPLEQMSPESYKTLDSRVLWRFIYTKLERNMQMYVVKKFC